MDNIEFDISDEDFPDDAGAVVELATLEKYLHDTSFTNRFIHAAASEADVITRTAYYPKEKSINEEEFFENGYAFFEECQNDYSQEYEIRLKEMIDPEKVDIFLESFRKLWVDGSSKRHLSEEMMSIKASIRDHDREYFPNRQVFVNKANVVPESVHALFSPDEMHAVFDITSSLADTCIDDYIESRKNKEYNSINSIYLHRGIFREKTSDQIQVEDNYLSSYSMAVTVPEVFAQTFTKETQHVGRAAMIGAPYPLFNKRIVMFAPFIRGMKLGQLEVCVAPPLEIFPLKHEGSFESGYPGLIFDEYSFDQVPPMTKWVGPIPDSVGAPDS